jgi:DNA polymerase
MLVGEAPGREEDCVGRPFVGEAGRLLNHILDKLDFRREDLYITNVLKCRPPRNKLPARKELLKCWKACRLYLMQEIKDVHPKVILLMGGTALSLMSSPHTLQIGRWEGMRVGRHFIVTHKSKETGRKCGSFVDMYASYHPAAALRNPSQEAYIAAAIYGAAKVAGLKVKPKGIEAGLYPYETRE